MLRAAAALAILALGGCTWEERQAFDKPDRSSDVSWSDSRLSPQEAKDARELAEIESRIGRGELPKVQFDFDSDKVREESYRTLDVVADWMLRHPDRKVRITAHTCSIGTPEYNMDLSIRRAKSVKQYLVGQGVPPPSIRFRGAGLTEPLVDNSTEENREKNRRVEFRLVYRDWDSVY